jgi:Asp-tRNA(Asn)/Glu-tRNA(Gln) amidotransferase A subunit family amidase
MSLYVERWHARPAWLDLSISERVAYLDQMEEGIRALTEAGATVVGLVLKEVGLPDHRDCQYIAVWSMPDGPANVRMLDAILEEAGWGRYFNPVETGDEKAPRLRPRRTRTAMPSRSRTNGRRE